ncbi:glycosyltransferase [Sphingomonas naphthae]|uniref:Glycosyltransferase n=1 Tax=Sphingomonas naphthae TaxID=1813468 RepID=A0ABY7TH78_9SPHN|nr:glycosyltransferase [Sphingomonas naphthae]WCT72218.1 glycosyltransferase [Sphingomonas naphthae]
MSISEPRARSIALVLHDFPAGGTERIAIRLANHWAAAGRAVTILCGHAAGPALALVDPAVAIVPVDPPIPRSPTSRWRLGRALATMMPPGRFDILVAPGNFHLPVMLALRRAARHPLPPLLLKISNPVAPASGFAPLDRLAAMAARLAFRRIDHLVAMSPTLAEEAGRALGRRDITALAEPILPDAVPPPAPRPARRTLLVAGRLVPQKNVALAIDAFAALRRKDIDLVIVGDGAQRAMLEARAAASPAAGRIRFAGHVPDIAPFLAQATALLSPSRYEGYPAALIEALAAGVPVVTTRSSPAIDDMLRHPSFGRIATANAAALAEAIEATLAAGPVDPVAAAALLSHHRARVAAGHWLAHLDGIVAAAR